MRRSTHRRSSDLIIDAHVHVWDLQQGRYDWPNGTVPTLNRTFDLDELLPSLARTGVDAVLLVQAANDDGDTARMMRVAEVHPQVAGVIGWVPLDEPDEVARRVVDLGRDGRFVGVRDLIHTRPDPAWILRTDVGEGLEILADNRLPYDFVMTSSAALRHIPTLSERHPGLHIVIDHLGHPPIDEDDDRSRARWRRLLSAAAEHPAVSAKLTELQPVSGTAAAAAERIRPFLDDALDLFGPSRLMYGGDWPLSIDTGGYDHVWSTLDLLLNDLRGSERAAILGGTATEVYRLGSKRRETLDRNPAPSSTSPSTAA
jgi:L-fuconolactonase